MSIIEIIERLLQVFAALLLIVLAVITLIDVIGRYVFNNPIGGAFELVGIGMALMIFAALPRATAENKHIQVSLVNFLPEEVKTVLQAIICAITAAGFIVLGWRLLEHAMRLADNGDFAMFTRIPYAPVAGFMASCAALAGIFLVIRLAANPRQPVPKVDETES